MAINQHPLSSVRIIETPISGPAPPLAVALTPDGKQVLTSGLDFQLRLWNLETGTCAQSWDARGPLMDIRVTPSGSTALLGAVRGIVPWDLDNWDLREPNTFWSHSEINAVDYAPGTDEVLAGGEDTTIHRWTLNTGAKLPLLTGHKISITDLGVTPNGQRALSADLYGQLRYWDLSSGKCIQSWQGSEHHISALALSPDGRFALTGDGDGSVVFWEIHHKRALRTTQDQPVQDIALSPDYRWAYAATEAGLSRWDLKNGTLDDRCPLERLIAIDLSPDGKQLAGIIRNHTILVWSLD